MARLFAKENYLFYPTPLSVMELIASNIAPGEGAILDPCCGEGEALALLGDRLGLTTHGNELHHGRYIEAKDRLDFCLNGGREFLKVNGKFSMIFDNPPYDHAISGKRMEYEHIKADLALMGPHALGVWVVPESVFNWEFCSLLAGNLTGLRIRRFPDVEFKAFKQVVIFGNKRFNRQNYLYNEASQLQERARQGFPVLQAHEFEYDFPYEEIYEFDIAIPELGAILSEVESHGVQESDSWDVLLVGSGAQAESFRPILPLSSGHTAMTIAAGIVDGADVEIEGKPHILKGFTRKRVMVSEETNVKGRNVERTTTEREKLVQTISALNLSDGTLVTHNSLDDKDSFAEFLLSHQETLVRSVTDNHPPLFDPEKNMPQWSPEFERIHAPGVLPGQIVANGLLPAQQIRAAALADYLKQNKTGILVGDMGTGKTSMSQAIMALSGNGNWKLVVVCPSQVTQKWKREAEKVLREFGVKCHVIGDKHRQPDGNGKIRKIAKPVLDVDRAINEDDPSILIMSYQTAKNGSRWEHAPIWAKRPIKVKVVEKMLVDGYWGKRWEHVETEVTRMFTVAVCPDCGQPLIKEGEYLSKAKDLGRKKWTCQACGSPIWQEIPFKYGGRVAIAHYLNKHYSGQFNLIIDEVHHVKGSDTDSGYASTDLITAARKVIAMTGTIYGGKASSIFHLLYRLSPDFQKLYAYNEVQKFIEHHGLQETIVKEKGKKGYHSTYGYNRVSERVREIPGVSPAMVMKLLNQSVFIKMDDMGLVMPEYREERLPVALDERLDDGLESIKSVHEAAVKQAIEGKPGLLSAWLYASLGWVDCPIDEVLEAKDDEGEVTDTYLIDGVLSSPRQLLDEPLAKDKALVDYIETELAQGRGCGVYFAQVNRRDWMGRIQALLESRGIYSEILRQSTCKPEDREAWYQKFVERCRGMGQEPVLLANGNLVKEGLDLIELPTLIETGIEYRINNLRQTRQT